MPSRRYIVYPHGGGQPASPYLPQYDPSFVGRWRAKQLISVDQALVSRSHSQSALAANPATPSLLRLIAGAGPSTYMLSGVYSSSFSATPIDALNYGTTGGAGSSSASWAGSGGNAPRIGYPGYPYSGTPPSGGGAWSGLTPCIYGVFTVAGPQVDASGGWYINEAPSCPYFTANSPPNDCYSQAIGAANAGVIPYVTMIFANPVPGENPWTTAGGVLGSGSTNSTLMGYVDTVAEQLLNIPCAFILALPGELNLGAPANWNTGGNWMAMTNGAYGGPSAADTAQLYEMVLKRLQSDGVKNCLVMWVVNQGVGNYGWGAPDTTNGLSQRYYDIAGADGQPFYNDTSCYSYLTGLGVPICADSVTITSSANGVSPYSFNFYTGTGGSTSPQCVAGEQIPTTFPEFFGAIYWGAGSVSLNLQSGALQCLSSSPYIASAQLPSPLPTVAGGIMGG